MSIKRATISGPHTASRRCYRCPDDATHLVRTANGVYKVCGLHVGLFDPAFVVNVTDMRNAA